MTSERTFIQAYLDRIHYSGTLSPTTSNLFALQRAHLLSIPFENLDIGMGRLIRLDIKSLVEKIIYRTRGGFCYELNGLFAHLLRTLGYQVTLLNARSIEDDGSYGLEYDHLVLKVISMDASDPWLVDVGWGNGPFEPLKLLETDGQLQRDRLFQLQRKGEYIVLLEKLNDQQRWIGHYAFTLQPHTIEDFSACCLYHQRSPESIFTQKRICTVFVEDGHVTLSDSPNGGRKLIISRTNSREERPIENEAEFRKALKDLMGIELELAPGSN